MDFLKKRFEGKCFEGIVTYVHPGINTGLQVLGVQVPPPVFINPQAQSPLAPYVVPTFNAPPTFYTGAQTKLYPPAPPQQQIPVVTRPYVAPVKYQSQPPFPVAAPTHANNANPPLFSNNEPLRHESHSLTSSFFGMGNLIQSETLPGGNNQENKESKVQQLLRIFPEASPHDAQKALDQSDGDLDSALSLLIDWRNEENEKTQEAVQVCQSTAFVVFPPSTNSLAQSSYPEWLKSGAMLNTMTAHSMQVALASTFPASGRQKALLVGINYDGTRDELNGPRQDLKRMGKMLEKVYGFQVTPYTRVELTDAPENRRNPIYMPTRRNILSAMKWLVADAQTGDVLFFHYSGHGSQKPSPDGTTYESDGLDETICPVDFRTAGEIRDDEIAEALIVNLPVGVRLFCVMDCCHSGTGLDLPFVCDVERGSWVKIRTKYSTQADVTLISGCQADQTSADLTLRNGKKAGGALTLALLSSMSAKPFKHTYHSLVSRTSKVLAQRGFAQIIQLSSSIPFDYKKRPFRFDNILGPL